jgi:hypothetical protein
MNFKIWYYKHFDHTNPVPQEWVKVKEVKATDLEEVFQMMQGEVWSPNGEARDLIRGLGLTHTSMSVGDFIEDEDGLCWKVQGCGFKYYDKIPQGQKISPRDFF